MFVVIVEDLAIWQARNSRIKFNSECHWCGAEHYNVNIDENAEPAGVVSFETNVHMKKCPCNHRYYCSKYCQKQDWRYNNHRDVCPCKIVQG